MEVCPVCNKEFPSLKSLRAHKAWHERGKVSLSSLYVGSIPPDFKRKVDLELDTSGTLKISVEVTPTEGEEVL